MISKSNEEILTLLGPKTTYGVVEQLFIGSFDTLSSVLLKILTRIIVDLLSPGLLWTSRCNHNQNVLQFRPLG